jgi:hypothetical protein
MPTGPNTLRLAVLLQQMRLFLDWAQESYASPCELWQLTPAHLPLLIAPQGSLRAGKLVFRGTITKPHVFDMSHTTLAAGTRVVVKYVTTYSVAAHLIAASKDMAPQLHDVVDISEGRKMVVMEDVSTSYVCLAKVTNNGLKTAALKRLQQKIPELHAAGVVHGDLHENNILVAANHDGVDALLVDFDWSVGPEETRVYPEMVNEKLAWAPGVALGKTIKMEHDTFLLHDMIARNEVGSKPEGCDVKDKLQAVLRNPLQ